MHHAKKSCVLMLHLQRSRPAKPSLTEIHLGDLRLGVLRSVFGVGWLVLVFGVWCLVLGYLVFGVCKLRFVGCLVIGDAAVGTKPPIGAKHSTHSCA